MLSKAATFIVEKIFNLQLEEVQSNKATKIRPPGKRWQTTIVRPKQLYF